MSLSHYSENLVCYAGTTAYHWVKAHGLSPNDVKAMTGAAGGPKWLTLGHLDRVIFSSWFKDRTAPLFLIGSSSGAWRFAAAAHLDPVAAIDRFQEAYIHQYYKTKPSPTRVHQEGLRIQKQLLGKTGVREILSHPYIRLNIMTVRCKGLVSNDNLAIQTLGMLGAIVLNTIHRNALKIMFERALFYDPRNVPPFLYHQHSGVQKIPLTEDNFEPALLASGSIPLMMTGIRNIPGAIPGTYRDGGIIDYHMDIPIHLTDGIVLFPHYTNRIIPGWLDKKIFWRHPHHIDRTLMIAPSPDFLKKLPYGKIPDRDDFKRFHGKDSERVAYWYKAVELSKLLAEEFMNIVESGKIKERVKQFRCESNIG